MTVPNLINVSSSVSTRATTLENANISGGFVAQTVLSGSGTLISGSALSTGSFGSIVAGGTGVNTILGNVGIGITNPSGDLHVEHATDDNTKLYLVAGGNTRDSEIFFGDQDSETIGRLQYDHNGDKLNLYVSGSNRMVIDGNTLISLSNNDAGTSNTIFGKNAGLSLDAGSNQNVFIGENVSDATMNDAGENTGVGYEALSALTTGDENTAIGRGAGAAITTGGLNTAVGKYALNDVNTGGNNVAVGRNSGEKLTTSSGSVYIGKDAGALSVTGNQNIGIGLTALGGAATTGDNNIAIGVSAGDAITSGYEHIAIGRDAGGSFTTGNNNIAIGRSAMQAATDPSVCIIIGGYAGYNINSTDANTTIAIGYYAAQQLTSGQKNTAIGYEALTTNQTSDFNTAVGYRSLQLLNGDGSQGCTAVGLEAGLSVTSGTFNTFMGYRTGRTTSTGGWNTVMGGDAAYAHTTASGSVILGYNAGGNIATGNRNIAIGYNTLNNAVTGDNNIAIGTQAGDALTSGYNNIMIGNGTGANDVNFTTGFNCTLIGTLADVHTAAAQNVTAIGYNTSGQGNNTVTLGNSDVTAVYMASDSGATVHCAGINMSVTQPAGDNITSVTSETLDHYEEGTWTPYIDYQNGTDNGNKSHTTQTGRYTKIGNRVFWSLYMDWSLSGTATHDNINISGFPFTSANVAEMSSPTIAQIGGSSLGADDTIVVAVGLNSSTAGLQGVGGGNTEANMGDDFGANDNMTVRSQGTYPAAT
jgi:hypothetical protein